MGNRQRNDGAHKMNVEQWNTEQKNRRKGYLEHFWYALKNLCFDTTTNRVNGKERI